MANELKTFINEIKTNCTLDLGVFALDGSFLCGNKMAPHSPIAFSDITTENGNTFFKFRFQNRGYIGGLVGDGEVQKKYALLILQIVGNYAVKNQPLSKEEFFRAVLSGESSFFNVIKYVNKFGIKDKPSCVMIITQDKGRAEEVVNIVSNYVGNQADCVMALDERQSVLIKFYEYKENEYRSEIEYGEFLAQIVYEETGIKIDISIGGTAKSITDLGKSFAQALSALTMSETIKLGGNVHSFREYILIKVLDDLTPIKKDEYLNLLLNDGTANIFSDEVMLETAEDFLDSSLNISETSRKMYLHRNTLNYRLDKIQKETGLDIRKFSDAVTFRMISILSKLSK